VPDLCTVNVDVRLTPAWDSDAALTLVRAHTAAVDTQWSDTGPTGVEVTTRWSAFALPPDSPLGAALLKAAEAIGVLATSKVAGPSNVGNYLAGLGIPATVGFGVARVGLHGSDERIGLASIPLVQATCHQALLRLLAVS
jgi:succinyl-diaminopimelate desuccinylase